MMRIRIVSLDDDAPLDVAAEAAKLAADWYGRSVVGSGRRELHFDGVDTEDEILAALAAGVGADRADRR